MRPQLHLEGTICQPSDHWRYFVRFVGIIPGSDKTIEQVALKREAGPQISKRDE